MWQVGSDGQWAVWRTGREANIPYRESGRHTHTEVSWSSFKYLLNRYHKHILTAKKLYLEYNNSVWAPYRKSDINKLEKVQKRATKMIQGMWNFKCPERLRQYSSRLWLTEGIGKT